MRDDTRGHTSDTTPQATLRDAITMRNAMHTRNIINLGAPMVYDLSDRDIVFLADMYQRIADQRRIADINRRDDRRELISAITTLIVVAIFFGMWFV